MRAAARLRGAPRQLRADPDAGRAGHASSPRRSIPTLTPLAELARHRVYIFSAAEAEGSPQRLGLLPRAPAAGLIVGQRPHRYAILFMLAEGWQLEELDFALNTIRASLDARLVDARVRGSFREAAEIQQSLLVEEPPQFAGFELAARSVAGRGGGRRLLRLPRPRRRRRSGSRSATPAATGFRRRSSCATW